MKKILFFIAMILMVNHLYSQFPAPTGFQFSYEYIMLGDWGVCDGQAVNGPTYCSHFNWTTPDTSLTISTLEYYVIYYNDNPLFTVVDTFYNVEAGFIGEMWVTAVYIEPDGESDSSNIVINPDLPISIENIKSKEKIKIEYNIHTKQLVIENVENIKLFKIYNIQGYEIISNKEISNTVQLDKLRPGAYIIEIIDKNDFVLKKKVMII